MGTVLRIAVKQQKIKLKTRINPVIMERILKNVGFPASWAEKLRHPV